MSLDPRTPVLVGVGQHTQHDLPATLAEGHAPSAVDLAEVAVRAALEDCGAAGDVAAGLDAVYATRTFADSTPRRATGFGTCTNFPRSIARRIGAEPSLAVYSQAGGNTPQKAVNEFAERLARGELDSVLLCGGEPLRTLKAAKRGGVELDWQEDVPGQLDDRGFGELWLNPSEIQHQITLPIHVYPLYEQALRGRSGRTVDQHLRAMAELFSPLSAKADQNPYAVQKRAHSAEEIATVGDSNPWIVHPYPRLLVARDGVDQAAAVVMMTVEKAEALGISKDRWVYLHGCADLRDRLFMSDRPDLHSSPAVRACGETAFDMAGCNIDDIAAFDLYSCFPSAVAIAAEELGVAADDPRGLSLTGGLPYFGGPGNNYTMHSIAEAVAFCRADPQARALVTGNGGNLTKHSMGIYSAQPVAGVWARPDGLAAQAEVDAVAHPSVRESFEGACTVEAASVIFKDGEPSFGVGFARSPGGERVAMTVVEPAAVLELLEDDLVGRKARLAPEGGRNLLTF